MEEPAQRSIPCKDWDKKRDPEPGSRTREHPCRCSQQPDSRLWATIPC